MTLFGGIASIIYRVNDLPGQSQPPRASSVTRRATDGVTQSIQSLFQQRPHYSVQFGCFSTRELLRCSHSSNDSLGFGFVDPTTPPVWMAHFSKTLFIVITFQGRFQGEPFVSNTIWNVLHTLEFWKVCLEALDLLK